MINSLFSTKKAFASDAQLNGVMISPEVRNAIEEKQPVVALESVNAFLHGGSTSQQKLETALRCEQVIRKAGALPATTSIFEGTLRIGMTTDELEQLAVKSHDKTLKKVSSRDIPFVVKGDYFGVTTVAAATFMADLSGIKFLTAGGLGGVHKLGQQTFDISADLQQISKSSVALVCSGSKAIIDPGLTLEYLETHSVPVIGYRTDYYPQFCTPASDIKLKHRQDSVQDLVKVLGYKWHYGLEGGVVIANPVPSSVAMEAELLDVNINRAISAMQKQGIAGSDCTEYLLEKVNEYSGGQVLDSNIALLVNNAALSAELAVAYSDQLLARQSKGSDHATID